MRSAASLLGIGEQAGVRCCDAHFSWETSGAEGDAKDESSGSDLVIDDFVALSGQVTAVVGEVGAEGRPAELSGRWRTDQTSVSRSA